MKIESEALKAFIDDKCGDIEPGELLAVIENLEQQQIDAPMTTRALWTSMGHHAEITYKGKHWTLRAMPGGWSALCNDNDPPTFRMEPAADLPSAMLAAEEFVLGEAVDDSEAIRDDNTDAIEDTSRPPDAKH